MSHVASSVVSIPAIRYSILYLEGSHDPDMMSDVVPRFEPFERCCMAILFVGGRGCVRRVNAMIFLGRGYSLAFFFGTLSLSKFIAVLASSGRDVEVLYVPQWQTRPPPRRRSSARTSSCSSERVELARLLVTVLPLFPCHNQPSLVLELAVGLTLGEAVVVLEHGDDCDGKMLTCPHALTTK